MADNNVYLFVPNLIGELLKTLKIVWLIHGFYI